MSMNVLRFGVFAAFGVAGLVASHTGVGAQKKPAIDTGPYAVVEDWPKQIHTDWTWGRTGGIWAESPDRVYVLQLGELPTLPSRVKADGTPARSAVAAEKETRFEHRLMVIDRNGKMTSSWDVLNDLLVWPHSVKVSPFDPERHVWIVDGKSGLAAEQVYKFTRDGKLVMKLGEYKVPGNDKTHFGGPTDIAFLPNGDFLVSDGYKNGRIIRFTKDGKYISEFGMKGKGPGQFNVVHSVAVDPQGRIFASDRENRRIQVFDQAGKFLYMFPGVRANSIMITQDGYLWASNSGGADTSGEGIHEMVKFSLDGKILDRWGAFGPWPGQMWGVHQFSVDSEGTLYTAEVYGGRAQKFVPKPGANKARMVGQPFVPKG